MSVLKDWRVLEFNFRDELSSRDGFIGRWDDWRVLFGQGERGPPFIPVYSLCGEFRMSEISVVKCR